MKPLTEMTMGRKELICSSSLSRNGNEGHRNKKKNGKRERD